MPRERVIELKRKREKIFKTGVPEIESNLPRNKYVISQIQKKTSAG